MRMIFGALTLALGLSAPPALADDAAPSSFYGELKQEPLTDADVQHYIEAMPDMRGAMGDAPADAAEPDAATMAKLEAVAQAHGFASFDAYNTVAGNIALVLDGIDPQSKTYVGAEKLVQRAMAQVRAQKNMSPADRDAALADLGTQMKSVTPVKIQSNIDIVLKHYDQLKEE